MVKNQTVKIFAFAIVFLAITSSVAFAQDFIDARNPQRILEMARGWGTANLETDSVGDPKIVGRMDGTIYSIYFFGCDDAHKGCRSIMFRAAWNVDGVTTDYMNEWNQSMRFGKAYLDNSGDPVIEMNINLDYGGLAYENLNDDFDWWRVVLDGFIDHLRAW